MAALPGLELRCFGAPTATVGGAAPAPEVLWRKHLALLVYLALSPDRRRSREHLLGLFWAEKPQDRARQNLNESLLRLRRSLGEERLQSVGTAVELNGEGLDVDALRFRASADRSPREAVGLVRGRFLEGFHVDDAPEFEAWMSAERQRLDGLAATVAVAAAQRELAEGRCSAAAEFARRAQDLEPYATPAIAMVMRALALGGDVTAALAAYHAFTERLERELHERPPSELVELAERIRRMRRPPAPDREVPREPPLVGRLARHRDAFDTLASGLAGGARTLLVTGAPGCGRSRLVAECAQRAALEGATIVSVRPLESDQDSRWSVLRHVARALAAAPGLPSARPEALAALAGLVPELAARFPPRAVQDVADVASALASLVAAVADEAPLLIGIDDAQWADGATLAALHAAMTQLARSRVVLITAVAPAAGSPPSELARLEADVGRGLAGVAVRLDPLVPDDLRLLVAALAPWCQEESERERLVRRIELESGGSPLFAVTLLGALEKATRLRADFTAWPPPHHTTDAPLPFSVPGLVRMAVTLRVRELDDEQIHILRIASICGQALDLDLVSELASRARGDVERALPAFERRQLVGFDGARYTFVTPLVAKVVRAECLTPGERRQVEARAVQALAGRDDLESRALRAELLARVERTPEALAFVIATIRDAHAAGAARLARRAWLAGDRMARAAGLARAELDALRGAP
jgi:DNA-binding SARP family transcriptional activator